MGKKKVKKDDCNKMESPELKSLMIDYLRFYKEISKIHSDKEFEKHFPGLITNLDALINKKARIVKTAKELKSYDISSIEKNTFVYTKQDTNCLSLLRHVRNAIAHSNLTLSEKDDNVVLAQDFSNRSGLSCYGLIDYDKFLELFKINKLNND